MVRFAQFNGRKRPVQSSKAAVQEFKEPEASVQCAYGAVQIKNYRNKRNLGWGGSKREPKTNLQV